MARMRTIKHGFFTNDLLAEVEPLGRLLFAGLWCIADREGRLEDRPRKIKAEVLPYDECDIDALLHELAKRDFIKRYTASGTAYIAITNFTKHQTPHIKEAASTIPAPCLHGTSTVLDITQHDTSTPSNGFMGTGIHTLAPVADATTARGEDEDASPALFSPLEDQTPSKPISRVASGGKQGAARQATVPVSAPTPAPRRSVNPLWDVLVEVMGYEPQTKRERSNWGGVVKELKEIDATAEDVRAHAENYVLRYGRDKLTVNAIPNNWSETAHPPAPRALGNGHSGHANGRYHPDTLEPAPLPVVRHGIPANAKPRPIGAPMVAASESGGGSSIGGSGPAPPPSSRD